MELCWSNIGIWIVYAAVSFTFSLFYGRNAVKMFLDTDDEKVKKKNELLSWRIHQFWINFFGCLIGWIAMFYLAFIRLPDLLTRSGPRFQLDDLVVLLIALLGIMGMLPYALSRISPLPPIK